MTRTAALTRTFRRHPRTWLALLFGIAVSAMLPSTWAPITRLLVSWDAAVFAFLLAIFLWFRGLTAQQIHSRYIDEDPSAVVILVIVTAAALSSLVATVDLLATLRQVGHGERIWHFVLVAWTLVGSWLLVPTMFTMHYADMFYSAPPAERPLSFPKTSAPVFWDFAYFAFTIAAANQTADVLTTRVAIRKVVIVQEIVSLVFNISVLGLAINVTAGLIGST